jgi:hypothetical protein
MAADKTTPPSASKLTKLAGRPPVDGATSRSMTSPCAARAPTRADTAVRERPVSWPISVRVMSRRSLIRA